MYIVWEVWALDGQLQFLDKIYKRMQFRSYRRGTAFGNPIKYACVPLPRKRTFFKNKRGQE